MYMLLNVSLTKTEVLAKISLASCGDLGVHHIAWGKTGGRMWIDSNEQRAYEDNYASGDAYVEDLTPRPGARTLMLVCPTRTNT